MYSMLLKIESPSNNNEYNYTPIYISYDIKSLHRPFCTSLLNLFCYHWLYKIYMCTTVYYDMLIIL